MKEKPRSRRKSPDGNGEFAADAGRQRWSLLQWCIAVCMCFLVFAVVFGSKLTTPVHATFSSEVFEPLTRWSFGCLLLAFFTGLLSVVMGYVHKPAGQLAIGMAGVFLACGISLFCIHSIADGLNVHFDSSASVKVTTPILGIVPPPSGSRQGLTLRLVDWRNPREEVSLRQDFRIVRVDVDKKYATFYVRDGFFGTPYAAEYR